MKLNWWRVAALTCGAFVVVCSFADVAAVQETEYRVKPVYPPPLERPELRVVLDSLPQGATGALPTFDGESFHINLSARGEARISEREVRNVINQVLRALAWKRDPKELQSLKRVTLPAASGEFIERETQEGLEKTKRRLSGELGPLSESTEKAVEELANELREEALRSKEIFVYEQRFRDVRLENSGVEGIWIEGRGLVAVTGRVFNWVKIDNQRKLSEKEAVKVARSHVGRTTKVLDRPVPKPELVILPYGKTMRYAWRLDVAAEEGSYRLWLDAARGTVLQLEPLFWFDSGEGLVFDPDPMTGTNVLNFELDGPTGGQYQLLLTGEVNENNDGADGATGDLTIADAGTGTADFNVPPINSTVVQRVSDAGYNSRFQEVNGYAWVYWDALLMEALGSQSLPSFTVTVNYNADNAWGGGGSITLGAGSGTLNGSTSASALYNTAIDATVVTHELGHTLTPEQMAVSGGTLTYAMSEGLSDFWAATIHNTPIVAGWSAQNRGAPVQTGSIPREAEALDVFPEHRSYSTSGHADGQIVNWALWSTRTGLNNLSALGALLIDIHLLDALTTSGVGVLSGTTDKRVHDSYLDLFQQLGTTFGTSSSIHKLLSGFARAGIHLSERDAVIDIDDDYLARGSATGPTFTIWTGRDYQFSGETAVAANVFNTRFEVEAANDAAFAVNLVSSGVLAGVTVSAEGVPVATWTLPTSDWNTLKAGDFLYYRVTTTDDAGGNSRISTSPGDGFIASVTPARAVINESGVCECTCAASASTSGASSVAWIMLVPPIVALVWRLQLRKKR